MYCFGIKFKISFSPYNFYYSQSLWSTCGKNLMYFFLHNVMIQNCKQDKYQHSNIICDPMTSRNIISLYLKRYLYQILKETIIFMLVNLIRFNINLKLKCYNTNLQEKLKNSGHQISRRTQKEFLKQITINGYTNKVFSLQIDDIIRNNYFKGKDPN